MLSVRPATRHDDTFLLELYVESRAEEVASWGWGPVERDAFLRMQFAAQRQHYAGREAAEILIVEHGSGASERRRCGRLVVVESAGALHLADVLVQAADRGRGIGSELLRMLQQRAATARKPLRLSVEHHNKAARRLYERAGFVAVGATQTHQEMQWQDGAG